MKLNEIKNILEEVFNRFEYFNFFNLSDFRDCLMDLCPKAQVYHGCSKVGIIFPGYPYIIKFDAREDILPINNGCLREAELYKLACEEEVEDFLPETEILPFTIKGFAFIQQKIITCYDNSPLCNFGNRKARVHYQRIASSVNRGHFYVDKFHRACEVAAEHYADESVYPRYPADTWVLLCIALYGKHKTHKFAQFVAEHGINDLHNGNIGFEGIHPKVLDFCGFDGSYAF